MSWENPGLTSVTTKDLETLLRVVFKKKIEAPLSIEGLARAGLQHSATNILSHLRELDERAIRATLTAVIAERRAAEPGNGN